MRAGDGADWARTKLDAGVDAFRKRLFRRRAADAAKRAGPVFLYHELRLRSVVNLPRELALRFGALWKLLATAMACLRDGIDDAVRILHLTQPRPEWPAGRRIGNSTSRAG